MVVSTTEAARLLGVSTARVRWLLNFGRIRGAYKMGRVWAIPLFNGMPSVSRGNRGPEARWRQTRKPATTFIHVNQHVIRSNHKNDERFPVIAVKHSKHNIYGHEIEINGPCRVIYRPDSPLSCGARVWIETFAMVNITCFDTLGKSIFSKAEVILN
ncbi:MAG: helix-turn-helix domain-containing protein [Nostocaceae cyanobacterium]|nr:helix-turn-helix domain-containing protein [Nostocaceae cyanobacterium]